MADLQKLYSRRNALTAQVKWEISVAKNLQERQPSQSEVKERLDQLKLLAGSFRTTQGEIEEQQTDPEAIASVFSVREEFFAMYYGVKNLFENYLEDIESSASQHSVGEHNDWKEALRLLIETQRQMLLNQAETTHYVNNLSEQMSSGFHIQDGVQVSNASPNLNVRLPAINVPIFSGERKQWMTFKDLYVSTIHSRKDLSDSVKM